MENEPVWSVEEVQGLIAEGRAGEALRRVEAVLAVDEGNGQAHFLAARALLELGRIEEACERGERLEPWLDGFFGWHWLMAEICLAKGLSDRALAHAVKGLALEPEDFALWLVRSRTELLCGRAADATISAERAVALRPDEMAGWCQVAAAAAASGNRSYAEKAFRQAHALRPQEVAPRVGLALLLCDSQHLQEAEQLLKGAVVPAGQAAAILWDAQARLFLKKGEATQALEAAQRAFALMPTSWEYALHRIMALDASGQSQAAGEALDAALREHPTCAELWNQQGAWQVKAADFAAARVSFMRAIEKAPTFASAHVNLGIECLRAGEWAQGWNEYGWRWKVPGFWNDTVQRPRWRGERLNGTLLILTEQGAGDTLQFLRFLPQIRSRVGRIVMTASDNLRRWIAAVPEVDHVIGENEHFPEHDAYIALMDLAGVLMNSEQSGIMPLPYPSRPDVQRRPRLDRPRRIAFAWAGNPKHTNDRNRSLTPEQMGELQRHCASVGSLEWLCFQRGFRDSGTLPGGIRAVTGFAEGDIEQTARELAAEADVVVTVDTALVHLAGTLGLPTLLLLPQVADWRWGTTQSRSIWYPTVRLLRQQKAGVWSDVIERLVAELRG
jgi:Flp pilus assembly protein TadD